MVLAFIGGFPAWDSAAKPVEIPVKYSLYFILYCRLNFVAV